MLGASVLTIVLGVFADEASEGQLCNLFKVTELVSDKVRSVRL